MESDVKVSLGMLPQSAGMIDLPMLYMRARLRNNTCESSSSNQGAIRVPACGSTSLALLWLVPVSVLNRICLSVHTNFFSELVRANTQYVCYKILHLRAELHQTFSHA